MGSNPAQVQIHEKAMHLALPLSSPVKVSCACGMAMLAREGDPHGRKGPFMLLRVTHGLTRLHFCNSCPKHTVCCSWPQVTDPKESTAALEAAHLCH